MAESGKESSDKTLVELELRTAREACSISKIINKGAVLGELLFSCEQLAIEMEVQIDSEEMERTTSNEGTPLAFAFFDVRVVAVMNRILIDFPLDRRVVECSSQPVRAASCLRSTYRR